MRLTGGTFAVTFWLLVLFEAMSLLGFTFPAVNLAFFAIILVGTLLLILARGLEAGLLVLFAELAVGSKGYLFSLAVGDVRLSIRLALFLLVMACWLVDAVRRRELALRRTPIFWPLVLFFSVVGYGAIRGLVSGSNPADVFFDGNGYLYAAVALPLAHVIRDRPALIRLGETLLAGLTVLALKTLFILFFFSHVENVDALRSIYRWIRVTGVGEMTRLAGQYYRIFFQSHIVHLVAFLGIAAGAGLTGLRAFTARRGLLVTTGILSSLVLIVSFSRSFWLALGISMATLLGFFLFQARLGVRRVAVFLGALILLFVLDVGVLAGFVNLPLPGSRGAGVSPASLIEERITGVPREAAATSRLLLLDPLLEKAGEHPVIGSGLGELVTTQTRDPRTKEVNEGRYTTYAFEWGYLDFLVKFGIVGSALLLVFFASVCRLGWQTYSRTSDPATRAAAFGLLFGLLGLLLTHMTTPYLNHPLGLGLFAASGIGFWALRQERLAA